MSNQSTETEDSLFVNFESLKTAIDSKDEMKILEELHSVVNGLSLFVLAPKVEDMSNPQILRVVSSQSKINNCLTHLNSIAGNLKFDSGNTDDKEKQLKLYTLIDDLQEEFEVFKSLVK